MKNLVEILDQTLEELQLEGENNTTLDAARTLIASFKQQSKNLDQYCESTDLLFITEMQAIEKNQAQLLALPRNLNRSDNQEKLSKLASTISEHCLKTAEEYLHTWSRYLHDEIVALAFQAADHQIAKHDYFKLLNLIPALELTYKEKTIYDASYKQLSGAADELIKNLSKKIADDEENKVFQQSRVRAFLEYTYMNDEIEAQLRAIHTTKKREAYKEQMRQTIEHESTTLFLEGNKIFNKTFSFLNYFQKDLKRRLEHKEIALEKMFEKIEVSAKIVAAPTSSNLTNTTPKTIEENTTNTAPRSPVFTAQNSALATSNSQRNSPTLFNTPVTSIPRIIQVMSALYSTPPNNEKDIAEKIRELEARVTELQHTKSGFFNASKKKVKGVKELITLLKTQPEIPIDEHIKNIRKTYKDIDTALKSEKPRVELHASPGKGSRNK